MGKRLPLTALEQGQIIAFNRSGMSQRDIANLLGRSKTVIQHFLKDPVRYGSVKSTGRPNKLSDRSKRAVIRKISNSSMGVRKVKSALQLDVSHLTVWRAVKSSPVIQRKKMRVRPKLTEAHKVQRLNYAGQHMNWNEEWKKVIFFVLTFIFSVFTFIFYYRKVFKVVYSDEKKFNLDGPDGYRYYWHDLRKEERVFSKRNFGGASVMVWAAFDATGMLPVIFITTRMDSADYQQLLEENLLPYWVDTYMFLHDNAPIHASRSTVNWLADKQISVINHPPCSPDLNPIENLFGIIVRDIYEDGRQYQTVDELKNAIVEAFRRVNVNLLSTLAESMKDRIFKLIRASGGHFD